MDRKCINCGGDVEPVRIELLDSDICAACAKQFGPQKKREAQLGISQEPIPLDAFEVD